MAAQSMWQIVSLFCRVLVPKDESRQAQVNGQQVITHLYCHELVTKSI